LFFHWDWEGAEQESERAIAINPGLAELHHLHAYVLEPLNRVEESLEEDKLCVELDPFGRYWAYAFALYRARRFEAAIKEINMRAEVGGYGQPLYEFLGLSHAHRGEFAEAVEAWKKAEEADGHTDEAKGLESAFREHGFSGVMELRYQLRKAAAKQRHVSQIDLAEAAAGAGHKTEALGNLEAAYKEHEPLMVRLLHNPAFDVLYEEPRFKELARKMKLPGTE
jgi:tetratricopeptide (TPR) repeat protein